MCGGVMGNKVNFLKKVIGLNDKFLGFTKDLGDSLFLELINDRRAIISFTENGCEGHFNSVLVRIVNINKGKIDQNYFLFDDILRSDKGINDKFEVIDYCCRGEDWSWYIEIPNAKSIKSLRTQIKEYIDLFKT